MILFQAILFASFVSAEDSPVSIIDIDDEFGDGYEREISASGSTSYHWTLFNIDSSKLTYNVSIEIENSNNKWSTQLEPQTQITLSYGDTEPVSLTVSAPNTNEGSTTVTLTFTIHRDGGNISRDQRETFTSLQPLEVIIGMFENPLPEPLDNEWGIFLLTVVFWLIGSLVLVFIMDPFVKAFTKKTKTQIDDIVLRIIRTPLLILVFFYGLTSSLIILDKHIPSYVLDLINSLYGIAFVLIIFYVAYKLFKDILVYYGELVAERTSSNIDDVIIPIVEKIGVVVIGLAALGYLLGYMNIDLTVFVAGGVVISMVIAFAAQETLSNFFAGIFILTDRPFREEDTIILSDGDWYEVRDIGLRSTRLFRFKDASLISIPNNKLAGDMIVNFSNPEDKTRVRLTVGVGYGTSPEKVKNIILDVVKKNPNIIQDVEGMKPFVKFNEMADSSINFVLQVHVKDRSVRWDVVDYLNTEIYNKFAEEGIEIPFPQRTIWLKKEQGDKDA
jgi:small-conductance mechanosensitive channel